MSIEFTERYKTPMDRRRGKEKKRLAEIRKKSNIFGYNNEIANSEKETVKIKKVNKIYD